MCSLTKGFAHYLWIETNKNGTSGKAQDVKVYFGEYTFGVIEKVNGEAFPKVKDFTLWAIDAKGNKTQIEVNPKEDYYLGTFTPSANGVYTLALNNNNIDVIDYTKYNFGIFKTHYHATTKVIVGDNILAETAAHNKNGIVIKEVSNGTDNIKLQVLYKDKPLPKNELKVFISDQWTKTLETDENGIVSFKLPWKTTYIVETTIKEEVPGTYKNKPYQFIWHCAIFSIFWS